MRDHQRDVEGAVRPASQPDAGGPRPRDVAGMARRGVCRSPQAEGNAGALPAGEDDILTRQLTRRQCEKR